MKYCSLLFFWGSIIKY